MVLLKIGDSTELLRICQTKIKINRFVLQECGDFTSSVSDCEELVEVAHRG